MDVGESLAAQAIMMTTQKAIVKVLQKHKLRKDSWHKTTSLRTMLQLMHNKLHRLEGIYEGGLMADEYLVDEAIDELIDLFAYAAFQHYVIVVDKVVDPNMTGEVE
jgi:hypothetical protein